MCSVRQGSESTISLCPAFAYLKLPLLSANANQRKQSIAVGQRLKAKREQQARLEEIRRANDEAARLEELERMRRVVASRGRAIQDELDERVRQHMASVVKEC